MLLYHGSETPLERFDRSHLGAHTRLDAFWLTTCPYAAAMFSGEEGVVTPVELPADMRLLDASGWFRGRPLHYPTPEIAETLEEVCDRVGGLSYEMFDAFCPVNIEAGFVPPLSESGYPAWEQIVWESEDGEDISRVFQVFGFDAVACQQPSRHFVIDYSDRFGSPNSDSPSKKVHEFFRNRHLAGRNKKEAFVDVIGILSGENRLDIKAQDALSVHDIARRDDLAEANIGDVLARHSVEARLPDMTLVPDFQ